jgi:hypothetical protein
MPMIPVVEAFYENLPRYGPIKLFASVLADDCNFYLGGDLRHDAIHTVVVASNRLDALWMMYFAVVVPSLANGRTIVLPARRVDRDGGDANRSSDPAGARVTTGWIYGRRVFPSGNHRLGVPPLA